MKRTNVEGTKPNRRRVLGLCTALILSCTASVAAAAPYPVSDGSDEVDQAATRCHLGNRAGAIQHVIYIQFEPRAMSSS